MIRTTNTVTRALCAAALLPMLSWAGQPSGKVLGKVLAIGSETGPLVAYIEQVPVDEPRGQTTPRVLTQKNTTFIPSVLVVVKGDKVSFPNEDKFFHNVFSLSPGTEFDLGLYRGGASKNVQLDQPGEVDVYCNIHENMKAKVLVLPNHFFAQANPKGEFSIDGLPPGQYVLVGWSASHEPVKQKITIAAGGTTRVDLALKKPRGQQQFHLNKNGEQYGRYH